MLSFRMREGDDVYFGEKGAPLSRYQQVIFNGVVDEMALIYTPGEILEVSLSDREPYFIDTKIMGVKMSVTDDGGGDDAYTVGMDIPAHIIALRGRNYRKALREQS